MAEPQTYGTETKAPDTVDLTKEEGRQVKDETQQQAGAVAGTAKEQAGNVANEAMGHARDLTENAKQQLHEQARQQTDALGGVIGTFGDRVHALADGNVDEAGPIGDYAQRLAGQVDQVAGRVNELGFDGMIDEVQRYARRRPGAFLLGATVAGFAASRLARGAKSGQQGDSTGANRSAGMSTQDRGVAATRPISANPTGGSIPPTPGGALNPPTTAGGMTGGAAVSPPPPMPRDAGPVTGSPATGDRGRNAR
ncbi:MAG: hypothetical protein WD378_05745 [Egicoccus sp.]